MILKQVSMRPFAGIADRTVEFDRGLTVVLGANEAGKSTLVNAIRLALFQKVRLTPSAFNKEVKRFLPAAGGDTIRVELRFEKNGEFRLIKSWGPSPRVELHLPGKGGLLTDDETVGRTVQELLVHHEATYRNVLIIYQSRLTETLHLLKNEHQPQQDLNAILRRAVFETDGVSIEKLGEAIENRYRELFDRWDAQLNLPEKNRGIGNPWKRPGKILQAYYRLEEVREKLREARAYERERDRINLEIESLRKTLQEDETFLAENRALVESVRQRALLEERLRRLAGEEKELKDLSQQWPVVARQISDLRKSLTELEERERTLLRQKEEALRQEKINQKLSRWRQAKEKIAEMEGIEERLNAMPAVDEEIINRLASLRSRKEKLTATLAAASLNVRFEASRPTKIRVRPGVAEEEETAVSPENPLELTAAGQVLLRHPDWQVTVTSGNLNFTEMQQELKKLQAEEEGVRQQTGVRDLSEARRFFDERKELTLRRSLTEGQLRELLGKESPEELAALEKEAGEMSGGKTVAQLQDLLRDVQVRLAETRSRLQEAERKQNGWTEQFGGSEQLLDKLVDTRQERRQVEKQLDGLAVPPGEFPDTDTFIRVFEEKEKRAREHQQRLSELRIGKADLDAREPEETSESLNRELQEAETAFQRMLRQGQAMALIRDRFYELKQGMDAETLNPWVESFTRYLRPLTGNRYQIARLHENLPYQMVRRDGLELPVDYLSVGTRDGLALALRLSMAEYFTPEGEGFLIMDDPLVDMDPERQKAAAEVLREFSRQRQLILLTCHPRHAELLGGFLIHL